MTAASNTIIQSASRRISITVSGVIVGLLYPVTGSKGAHDQGPPIHQNKEHDFERQRDDDGRQHHHTHSHQNTGHHHIDDKKGYEQNKPDLKRRLELAGHKCRHQHPEGDILRCFILHIGDAHEQREIRLPGLLQHEPAERLAGQLDSFQGGDFLLHVGLQPYPVGFFQNRLHDEDTDRKSTCLNSSHVRTSYAVFCLKKKTTLTPSLCTHTLRFSCWTTAPSRPTSHTRRGSAIPCRTSTFTPSSATPSSPSN